MGIIKREPPGVLKYPEDFEGIKSFQDAAKLVKKLNTKGFKIYGRPSKHGLPVRKDKRLSWLATAIRNYERMDIKSRYLKYGKVKGTGAVSSFITGKDGSKFQIFTNKKGRKICGAPLRVGNGWVCYKDAGFGTNHQGYGRCSFHEKELTSMQKIEFWSKLRGISKARSLADVEQQASELEPLEKELDADLSYLSLAKTLLLKKINSDIEIQERIAKDSGIKDYKIAPKLKDIQLLKELAVAGSNIKKNIHFIEARGMVPVDQIGGIIVKVLQAVTEGEDDAVRRRIAQRALSLKDDIVLPVFENDANSLPSVKTNLGLKMLNRMQNTLEKDKDWDEAIPKKARASKSASKRYISDDYE